VTLHFAYGSNMSRAIMRRHATEAQPIGVAELSGYRFVITTDGYASVVPARAHAVHGVLWRLTPRDVVTLNAWENVAGGLYRGATLAVDHAGGRARALVYLARPTAEGRPKLGYIELVIAAAREWNFPPAYIRSLQRWRPARRSDARTATIREFG
jgi:hypothetical protein